MYTVEQIREIRKVEAEEIRHAPVKSLCNSREVERMRYLLRSLLDHIEQGDSSAPIKAQKDEADE